MANQNPGDLLRRFVLDFLVEEALRVDPTIDGNKRRAMGASFSVEPMVDLGYARKHRVISPNTPSNRRVYIFLLDRPIDDKAFSSTRQLYKRSLSILKNGNPGAIRTEHKILIRETIKRQRTWDNMGFLISEVIKTSPDVPTVPLDRFSDIPRSLVNLGILEVYLQESLAGLKPVQAIASTVWDSGQPRIEEETPETHGESAQEDVSVHDWIKRAYEDTFGNPPIHVSTSSKKGPVITIRVKEISPKHETWAIEVTRHLRIREGALELSLQMLEVK